MKTIPSWVRKLLVLPILAYGVLLLLAALAMLAARSLSEIVEAVAARTADRITALAVNLPDSCWFDGGDWKRPRRED